MLSAFMMKHRPATVATRALLALVVLVGLSACSVSAVEDTVKSCSPSYELTHPEAGKVYVQQATPGVGIQWGVNATAKYKVGSSFRIWILIDGKNIDGKNQAYEPHGKVRDWTAQQNKGKVFEVRGIVTHGDDVLNFDAKCIIA